MALLAAGGSTKDDERRETGTRKMLQKAALRQEIEALISEGMTRTVSPGVAAIIEQPRRVLTPHYRPRATTAAEAMAAIGVKSSQVEFGAMRNLGRDRPFDWFSSERVDRGREAVRLPARDIRGWRDGLQHGQRGSRRRP
jgi:hypothetical protein